MTLAVKFTLLASITVASFLAVFGFVTYSASRNALNREIDAFGVNLARALALADPEWWSQDHGTLRAAIRRIEEGWTRYGSVLGEKYGITYRKPDSEEDAETETATGHSPEFRAQWDEFLRDLSRSVARNRERLHSLVEYRAGDGEAPSEIIDAFILYENQDKSVARANPEAKTFQRTGVERRYVADHDGTSLVTDAEIVHGRFPDAGPARSYSWPIRDASGRITHRAFVFLSESRIQNRLRSLLVKILLCTVGFIGLGAATVFLLTKRMTAPLADLVDDIEIVSSGDLTHRTRPQTSDEIGLLARTFDRMVRSLHEAHSERSEHQALKHEVAVASEIRDKLIPHGTPDVAGFEFEVLHLPADGVGHGYYDFLDLPRGRIGILVAEGAGGGLPATMTVVMARSLLRSEAERGGEPEAILGRANAALARDLRKGMYVAVTLAVLDPQARELQAFGAGNVSFIHYRASEKTANVVVPDGIALGFDPGPVFERSLRPTMIRIEPGDRFVFSNGGPERLRAPSGEALGEARWREIVERVSPKNSAAFVNIVGGSLSRFRGEAPTDEEVLVVTLKSDSGRRSA